MKPLIAVTAGDYNGIGPEVVIKAIARRSVRDICTPVLIGPAAVFRQHARRYAPAIVFHPYPLPRSTSSRVVALLDSSGGKAYRIQPGRLSVHSGAAAGDAIREAVRLASEGGVEAIVTAPVSKQAMHLAGIDAAGQTEFLQHLTRSSGVAMMLVSESLRIGLVTIHVPIRRVAQTLTASLLRKRIEIIHQGLRVDWRIRSPRLAVLGLNPHAGEGGDIGNEEQRVILPVVVALRARGLRIEGPFPSDAFFARTRPGMYDCVVAMYHDQGLIPLKMSARGRAVNVSVGLPLVRTSPDHGTAFDIAGKGVADPASMVQAIRTAVIIAANRRRKNFQEPS